MLAEASTAEISRKKQPKGLPANKQVARQGAAYGAALLQRLSKALTGKYGPGFSVNTLRKMRQFYLLNPIQPATVELDWTDYIELLPVKDEKTRQRLERRVLEEDLNSSTAFHKLLNFWYAVLCPVFLE